MWRPPPGNDKVTHLVRKWKQKSAPPLPASLSIWFLSTQECLPGNSWKQKDPGFPPALGSQAPLQDHSIACRQMPGVVKGCPPVGLGMYRLTWEAGESFQLPRGIRGARNASPRGLKCLPPASLVNLYCEQNAVGGKKQTRCVCVCVCVWKEAQKCNAISLESLEVLSANRPTSICSGIQDKLAGWRDRRQGQ